MESPRSCRKTSPAPGRQPASSPSGRTDTVVSPAAEMPSRPARKETTMTQHDAHPHGHGQADAAAPAGHDKHAGHSVEMFRDRFWLALALTVPTLIWEPMLQDWFGYRAPAVPGARLIPAVFGTAVFVYGGWVFLQGALRELAARLPGMMTLISLAISRLPLQPRDSSRLPRSRPLVGARHARHHHAARPLDRDALDLPGAGRAEGAREAPSRHGPAPRGGRPDRGSPVAALRDGDLLLIRPGASIPADGVV
jgi:P-type Cu2+ transporter